tara:strand:+ start:2110 stop:2412 length:303 start_codon:yes stop_codon:yes gene_type:complete
MPNSNASVPSSIQIIAVSMLVWYVAVHASRNNAQNEPTMATNVLCTTSITMHKYTNTSKIADTVTRCFANFPWQPTSNIAPTGTKEFVLKNERTKWVSLV